VVGLALVLALGFGGVGVQQALEQKRVVDSYVPVSAEIVSSTIEETSESRQGKREVSYAPLVTYRYTVGDRQYTSRRTTPLSERSSRRWAERVAALFTPGSTVQAYYDPRAPYESFLLRGLSFAPYLMLLCAFVLAALGLWLGFRDGVFTGRELLYPAFPPVRSDVLRRGLLLLPLSVAWHGAGWLAWLDFARLQQLPGVDLRPLGFFIAYEVLGLAPLLYGLYYAYLRLTRRAPDEPREVVPAGRFLRPR